MRKSILTAGTVLPLVLLFWPFAQWNDTLDCILRVVPAISAQFLLCGLGKRDLARVIPLILTGMFALWGTYLFCTSPSWIYATLGGLIADYISPFLGCAIAYALSTFKRRKGV